MSLTPVGSKACVDTRLPKAVLAHVEQQTCPGETWHLLMSILDRMSGRHLSHTEMWLLSHLSFISCKEHQGHDCGPTIW